MVVRVQVTDNKDITNVITVSKSSNPVQATNGLSQYYEELSKEYAELSKEYSENSEGFSKLSEEYTNLVKQTSDKSIEDLTLKTKEISKDIQDKGDEVNRGLEETQTSILESFEQAKLESLDEIGTNTSTSVETIQNEGLLQVNTMNSTKDLAVSEINTSKTNSIQQIDALKTNSLEQINTNTTLSLNEIRDELNTSITSIDNETEAKKLELQPYVDSARDSATSANTSKERCEYILDRLGTAIKIKGRVNSLEDLPTQENLDGDAYLVGEDGLTSYPEYYWYQNHWEFLGTSGGGGTWGTITGDITTQSDLQTEFGTKQDKTDNNLLTDNKTIVGAINDIAGGINSLASSKQDKIDDLATIRSNANLVSTKQDKLTAGDNIDITNNVISASGGKQMTFAITEDMVTVTTDDTKGVAPYNTAYYYTNITINENAGVEWVEGAFYSFIVNTKMVVTSSYRNVRVRIGESGDWKPVMMYADVLVGSTYFVKALNTSFQYKSVYQINGALHKLTDTNSTYTLNQLVDQSIYVAGDGTYAITRYSIIMEKPNHTWEKITDTSKNYTTATTKTVNTNGFVLGHIRYYLNSATLTSGAKMGASYCAIQYSSVSFSYSTNCNTTPGWKTAQPVFLIGSLGADGLFYLDTKQWWGFTYPTENDGKLYIRIGTTVNTTDSAISFCQDKPIYYHDGTQLREYIVADNKQDTISDLATIRSGASAGATAIQSVKTINNESIVGSGNIDVSGYRPTIFDLKWADHLINDIQWLRADTFSWQSGDVYTNAYNKLVEEYATGSEETEGSITFKRTTNGFKIATADYESAILDKYNDDGIAWYYILDTANKRFKLPRTKWGFKGLRTNVGDDIDEKLPNINGSFASVDQDSSGAISNSGQRGSVGGGTSVKTYGKNFSASSSSSTYQDNAPVQERATQMYLYFYVGEYAQTAIEQTAGLNSELFNGKLDINASNLNTQGKSYISGLGMPSTRYVDLTLGANDSDYYAPANGYFFLEKVSSASGQYANMQCSDENNNYLYGFELNVTASGNYVRLTMPVKKGHKVIVGYNLGSTTRYFRFIYAEGEA